MKGYRYWSSAETASSSPNQPDDSYSHQAETRLQPALPEKGWQRNPSVEPPFPLMVKAEPSESVQSDLPVVDTTDMAIH